MSYQTAKAKAQAVIYKTFGEDVVYTARGKDAATIRAIPEDELSEFPAGGFETTFRYVKNLHVIQKADVEQPTADDYVKKDGINYVVAEFEPRNEDEWYVTWRPFK